MVVIKSNDLPAIPEPILRPCLQAVELPNRALTEADVAKLWYQDRAELGKCKAQDNAKAQVLDQLYKKQEK